MKEYTEIIFILDKSGSMYGLEDDTIGGYNSFLDSQKKVEGEALVSTVLFDESVSLVHNRVSIKKVKPLTSKEYVPGGGTALLDAVGLTITNISKLQEEDSKKKIHQTIVVIITDGMENASREYSYSVIQKMIKEKKKQDWKFIFLGANIEAPKVASTLGIDKKLSRTYVADSFGTAMNYRILDCIITSSRSGIDTDYDELFKEIEEYEKKKKN